MKTILGTHCVFNTLLLIGPILGVGCKFHVAIHDNIKPTNPALAGLCERAESAHIGITTALPAGKYEFQNAAWDKSLFLRAKSGTELTWVLDLPKGSIRTNEIDSSKLAGLIEFSRPVFAYIEPGLGLTVRRIEVQNSKGTVEFRLGKSLCSMLLELGRASGKGEKLPDTDRWLEKVKLAQIEVALKEVRGVKLSNGVRVSFDSGSSVSIEHIKRLQSVPHSAWEANGKLALKVPNLELDSQDHQTVSVGYGNLVLPYVMKSGQKETTLNLGDGGQIDLRSIAWDSGKGGSVVLQGLAASKAKFSGVIGPNGTGVLDSGHMVLDVGNANFRTFERNSSVTNLASGRLEHTRFDAEFSTKGFSLVSIEGLRLTDLVRSTSTISETLRLQLPKVECGPWHFDSTQNVGVLKARGLELTLNEIERTTTNEVVTLKAGGLPGVLKTDSEWSIPSGNSATGAVSFTFPEASVSLKKGSHKLNFESASIKGESHVHVGSNDAFLEITGMAGNVSVPLKDSGSANSNMRVALGRFNWVSNQPTKVVLKGLEVSTSFDDLRKVVLSGAKATPFDLKMDWPVLQMAPLIFDIKIHTREGTTQLKDITKLEGRTEKGHLAVNVRVEARFPVSYREVKGFGGLNWPFKAEDAFKGTIQPAWSLGDPIQLPSIPTRLPELPKLPPELGIKVPTPGEIAEQAKQTVSGMTESVKTIANAIVETVKQFHIDVKDAAVRLGTDFSVAGSNLGELLNRYNEQLKAELAKIIPNLNTHEDRNTSISAIPVLVIDDLELGLTSAPKLRDTELTKTLKPGAHSDPFIFKPDGGHELVRFWLYIQGTVLGGLATTAAALSPAFPQTPDKPFNGLEGWIGDLHPSRVEFGEWEANRFSIKVDAEGPFNP